jgi:hypothetical protein
VTASPSPSIWSGGEVDFIIRNQVDDILPRRSASVKVKAPLSSAGGIECCFVYELIDQRNESKPIMGLYQVFIAVRVFAIPLIKKYDASAVMFMTRKDQFIGSKCDMKWLKEEMKRLNEEMKQLKVEIKQPNEEMKRLKEEMKRINADMKRLDEGMKRLKRAFYESTWSIMNILLHVTSKVRH